MRNKAQSAMELIMTYGWALFIVLFAIGALYYFSLSPEDAISPSCIFTGELSCEGFKIFQDKVGVELRNNVGREITVTRMDCTQGIHEVTGDSGIVIQPGAIQQLECDFPQGISGSVANANVVVYYVIDGDQFPKTIEGNVIDYVGD